MLQHIWTVPCRFSTADRESNNVSLIEVLEELTIALPPTPLPEQRRPLIPAVFDVVTLWGRENEEQAESGFGRLILNSPGGESLLEYDYDIDLRENRRFRTVARVQGFPAETSGRYLFKVERRQGDTTEWEQVAVVPLWVNIVRPENQTGREGDVQ